MKQLSTLLASIGICSMAAYCHATPASKVLLAQVQTDKIAQVASGTLKTAHASWWGFDKADSTEALQNAVKSGVPVLIVDNMGSDWIINKPIELVSNQQIIFKDGVVIQAKKGMFKGKKDPLFNANTLQNLQLIGEGNATFRMHREDYANPKLYEKAEWRHGIALRDCENVIIRGLTVEETGGDGLYLGASAKGFNKNVLVENCTFDKNYRQGISVISAQDLMIRNCKMNNTAGTNPQFGIDFEPNGSGQRVVNCVLENCELSGNKGGGVVFSIRDLEEPISITLDKCTFSGNSSGLFSTISGTSQITVQDCVFDHQNISIRNSLAERSQFLFKDCLIDYSNATSSSRTPIYVTDRVQLQDGIIGGIVFEDTTVKTNGEVTPFRINFKSNARLAEKGVSGNLLIADVKTGETTKYDLDSLVQSMHEDLDTLYNQQPASITMDKLQAPSHQAVDGNDNKCTTRNKFIFLQYAQSGEEVTIALKMNRVYERATQVELFDPNGVKLQTYQIPIDQKSTSLPITFTAQQSGIYRLVRDQDFTQMFDIQSTRPGNGFLIDEEGMDIMPRRSTLYFEVPAGVKQFVIGIAPEGTASAVIIDPQGNEVARDDSIKSPKPLTATRADASHSEIWSLEVSSPVRLHLYNPLIPVFSTNPETLLRLK